MVGCWLHTLKKAFIQNYDVGFHIIHIIYTRFNDSTTYVGFEIKGY